MQGMGFLHVNASILYVCIYTYTYIHIYIFTYVHISIYTHYIQFSCGPIPATVPGMGPKTRKSSKKGITNLVKIIKNWGPEGSRRLLGEVLGPFWHPRVSQGRPDTKKCWNRNSRTPPGAQLGDQIRTFCRYWRSFFPSFFWLSFWEVSGSNFFSGFGVFFG